MTDVNEPPPKLAAPTVAANSTTPTTKLDASWTAPTMTGKPAVDDYDVRYKKTGDSTWTETADTTDSTALSATLSSLTEGKTYEVQVRAGNDEGDGPWSDSGTAITHRRGRNPLRCGELGGGNQRGRGGNGQVHQHHLYLHPRPERDGCQFV